ncbi:hypothetical protein JCM19240_4857 [Vibrio maritimus]|uniref:Uncharacterized protein n=1 Tax=Vibrio maritimus TaxID=990268 RepID=A0A090TYI3_9VIBR|nr:hypothetical protein JCM19240_4857 [Vibrio maritimus]
MSKLIAYLVVVLGVLMASYHPKEVEAIIGFDAFHNVRMMIREMEAGFERVLRTLQSL